MKKRTLQSHCKFGHALVPENLYVFPNGKRRCLTCKRAWSRNDPKGKVSRRQYKHNRRISDPSWAKRCDLKWKYNLSLEDYDAMLERQERKCAICKKSMDTPHVDHDHVTHQVRELLCKGCNFALGFLRDDETTAANLVVYIKKWKSHAFAPRYLEIIQPRRVYTRRQLNTVVALPS